MKIWSAIWRWLDPGGMPIELSWSERRRRIRALRDGDDDVTVPQGEILREALEKMMKAKGDTK